jgi:Fe2+ or Zn2+ uptake regulation protein
VPHDLADDLRACGLQVTAQRLAVLEAVRANSHASADSVWEFAVTRIGSISRQAVYDALAALTDAGLVRRIQPAGSPARFEGRVHDNHHHMICRECGHLVDVDCATGAVPCLTPSDSHGFEVDEAEVVYWGRCASCKDNGDDPVAAMSLTGKNSKSKT